VIKTQFLANISHELRTPLNAILRYCKILNDELKELGDENLLQTLERIHTSAKHLLGIISKVLEITALDSGQAVIQVAAFEINKLISFGRVSTPVSQKAVDQLACP
jgi:signal transduction histidine kinase